MITVVFFVLCLTGAIFQPIMNQTLNDLVDHAIYDNSIKSGNNGDVSYFYSSLMGAKVLVVGFFSLFFYILAGTLLAFGILSSLRREQSDYAM